MPAKASKLFVTIAVVAALMAAVVAGQAQESAPGEAREAEAFPAEFQFARLAYASHQYARGRRGRGSWRTDWPDAEHHFLNGVRRLTRVQAAENGQIVQPLDESIFDYPWIYAVEVGQWSLNQEEAAHIREYLLRGGFLMVDDFHGTWEWAAFKDSMDRVFPDRPIVDIPEADEVFHVLYDLDQRIQIPGRRFIYTGVTWESDGYTPFWRGIYDDDGRLMVAINFNMDLGDAWEHADWPDYPENMTALAYRFGVNYLIYSMTH